MRLQADDLSFRYGKGRPILRNLDFGLDSDEFVGLLGPSGQGKSTLAKILAGYLDPTGGSVTIDGVPHKRGSRNPVQLIFQHPERSVNPRWKMWDTLQESWTPPSEVMEALGIQEDWLTRYPNELSGGELQRFCVARALGPETKFLLCDEITTMLDAVTQADIWNFLADYTRQHQIGVLMITHSPTLADVMCTRIEEFSGVGVAA